MALLLLAAGRSAPSAADNYHDHASLVTSATDLLQASTEIHSIPLATILYQLDQNSGAPPDMKLRRLLTDVFGLTPESAEFQRINAWATAEGRINGSTFGDLLRTIDPTQPDRAFTRLVSVPNGPGGTPEWRRQIFLHAQSLRTTIMQALPPAAVQRVYERCFRDHLAAGERQLHLTVPFNAFLSQLGLDRVAAMRAAATAAGVELKVFMGLTRRTFLNSDENFPDTRDRALIERLQRDGVVHGVDVTGSLMERPEEFADVPRARIEQRLRTLLDFASGRGLIVRLHAFEGYDQGTTTRGVFYEALESVLRAYDRPLHLRIGHIAYLNEHWLRLLAQRREHLRIYLDANIASNMLLQGIAKRRLAELIVMAHSLGLPVGLGGDGRGTLPNATYFDQMARAMEGQNRLEFPLAGFPGARASIDEICFMIFQATLLP